MSTARKANSNTSEARSAVLEALERFPEEIELVDLLAGLAPTPTSLLQVIREVVSRAPSPRAVLRAIEVSATVEAGAAIEGETSPTTFVASSLLLFVAEGGGGGDFGDVVVFIFPATNSSSDGSHSTGHRSHPTLFEILSAIIFEVSE